MHAARRCIDGLRVDACVRAKLACVLGEKKRNKNANAKKERKKERKKRLESERERKPAPKSVFIAKDLYFILK